MPKKSNLSVRQNRDDDTIEYTFTVTLDDLFALDGDRIDPKLISKANTKGAKPSDVLTFLAELARQIEQEHSNG